MMCSNVERPEILIILHICLFLMSYDSSEWSLGDIETIVTSNQSMELDLSLGKFHFKPNYSCDSLYIGLHPQSFLRVLWWPMKHSQGFLMLTVTQPLLCFWVSLVLVSSPTIIHELCEAYSNSLVHGTLGEIFNFCFWGRLSSINKIFILVGGLGTELPFDGV